MYPVSEAFLQAVQENTRRYYWTGRIMTTKGVTYEFGADDIVKGSGYISSQCYGSTEIELGTVYAAEMGITLLSDIDRYTLEDALVELFYHLKLADGSFEGVPMGIFEVSEANRNIKTLELKAYDYMLRFDKSFNGFETIGTVFDFVNLCGKACRWHRVRRIMKRCPMEQNFFPFIRRMILRATGMCSTMWGRFLVGFSVSTERGSWN